MAAMTQPAQDAVVLAAVLAELPLWLCGATFWPPDVSHGCRVKAPFLQRALQEAGYAAPRAACPHGLWQLTLAGLAAVQGARSQGGGL